MDLDDIRYKFERQRPPSRPESTWRDGEGPQRRLRPGVVLVAIAVIIVGVFVLLLIFNPGTNSPEAQGDAPDGAVQAGDAACWRSQVDTARPIASGWSSCT